eukprot:scaffold516722_cov63-Attheya_sp.AAC.2
MEVHNVIAIICHGNFIPIGLVGAAGSHTQHWLALSFDRGQISYGAHRVFMAKWCNLHWNGKSWSESLTQLGLIHYKI